MTEVYLACRDGIQSRAVLGLFSTEAAARACCEDATHRRHRVGSGGTWDGDGWHDFRVERMHIDSDPAGAVEAIDRWTRDSWHDGRGYAVRYAWHSRLRRMDHWREEEEDV